jgi:hypothetical protein
MSSLRHIMPASGAVFHQFGNLPTELRLAIWRECLPQRVVELDFQPTEFTWWTASPPCNGDRMIQHRNKAPPLITRVCRESRQVAFETGRQLSEFPGPDNLFTFQQLTIKTVKRPWFDKARDVVHINWMGVDHTEYQVYDGVDPLHCVASYAAQTEARRASIRLHLLEHNFRWTDPELADIMRAHGPSSGWTVLMRDPIVVHGTDAATSGLFGLLGDAPVQLVDVSDESRICEFLRLGNRPGVTFTPESELDELDDAKQDLQCVVDDIFGPEAPAMRPVVMFRLCTQKCVYYKTSSLTVRWGQAVNRVT